jgi:hypothetical protein
LFHFQLLWFHIEFHPEFIGWMTVSELFAF